MCLRSTTRPAFTSQGAFRVLGKFCKGSRLRSQGRGLQVHSTHAPLQDEGRYLPDTSSLMDGPDLFVMRSAGNLGAIEDSLKGQPSDADIKAMQDVPNRGTVFEGIYLDAPAIFGSTILLSVLLFLSLERVLGLDQWLAKARQRWKDQKADKEKWAVYDARKRLEETFSSSDEMRDDK